MICKIKEKRCIGNDVYDMQIEFKDAAKQAKAGQFLHILCGDAAYLRRPISICEIKDDELRFIFRVKGVGTKALAEKNTGDMLDVLGPLGNGFDIENVNGKSVLIGGGIGIFPLLQVAKKLDNATVLLGFRTDAEIMLKDEFLKYTDNVLIATDDGSFGFKGTTADLLLKVISDGKPDRIYTCGPMPMMKAISDIAVKNGIKTQVSLEERMGCGIGACMTCTCNVAGEKKRVCKDGPVFDASEVDFNG